MNPRNNYIGIILNNNERLTRRFTENKFGKIMNVMPKHVLKFKIYNSETYKVHECTKGLLEHAHVPC